MSRLEFISDVKLKDSVEFLLLKSYEALKSIQDDPETIFSNVIDPFSAIFEASGFNLSNDDWVKNEKTRQAQKTLQNHIGTFHQKILGSVSGWLDLCTGKGCDIVSEDRKIIAEIKNKHNTVSGGKLNGVYDELNNLIMPKVSKYKGYTAYYVQIIPKNPTPFDQPFTPPDKSNGNKKQENSLIREIDGRSFYSLVTGVDDALDKLFKVIPEVLREINNSNTRNILEPEFFNSLFERAYLKKEKPKRTRRSNKQ